MTEAEWITTTDFGKLTKEVERLSVRKQRLFAADLCRHLDFRRTGIDPADILNDVEQFADTGRTKRALRQARVRVREAQRRLAQNGLTDARLFHTLELLTLAASERSSGRVVPLSHLANLSVSPGSTVRALLHLFRRFQEVAGPDGGCHFSPDWRTSTAVALAARMYEARDFGVMPILADALQDAGCDRGDVLAHCRGDGPHVRGCWVVDLVLGRS
jgi:hypothetical protein